MLAFTGNPDSGTGHWPHGALVTRSRFSYSGRGARNRFDQPEPKAKSHLMTLSRAAPHFGVHSLGQTSLHRHCRWTFV